MPRTSTFELPIPPGTRVVVHGGTGQVVEVTSLATEPRRAVRMAKMVGTGKDPLGRFPKGHIFDSPAGSPEYLDLIESGVAEDAGPAPGHSGLKREVEVANAVVRGDSLGSEEARAHAEKYMPDEKGKTKVSAHDVVHSDGGTYSADPNDAHEPTTDPSEAASAERRHEGEANKGKADETAEGSKGSLAPAKGGSTSGQPKK
jgi:hypothetical protein